MKIALLLLLYFQDPEAEFRDLVQHVLTHTEEFKLAQKTAKDLGVDVALYGGSSRDLAFFVREEIRQGRAAELRQRRSFRLVDMLGTESSDIDLIATGQDTEFQNRLNREHPPMGEFYRWEVKPVEKLDNDVERTQGRITVDKMLLTDTPWNLPERVTEWHNEGLRDVQAGLIRYHRSPDYFKSPEYIAGQHDESFEVMRLIRFLTGYKNVEAAPGTLDAARAVMESAHRRADDIKSHTLNKLFTRRMQQNLTKIFLQSTDLDRTDRWVEELRLKKLMQAIGHESRFEIARFARS